MRPKLYFAVMLAIFASMAFGAFGQEVPKQDVQTAQMKIFERCRPSAVDVETFVTLNTGEVQRWAGSGTFISKDAEILTAAHVVKEAGDKLIVSSFFGQQEFKIISYDCWIRIPATNRKYHASRIGADVYRDLALIKAQEIGANDFMPIKLGNSDALKIGDPVYAIGNSFGVFSNSFTGGHVSGLHRVFGGNYLEDSIQSDVSIQPGNSGGALVNADCELVGVNTRGVSRGGPLALSVPINFSNLDQLRKGDVALPWFGAEALLKNFARTSDDSNSMFEDLAFLNELTGIRSTEQLKALAKASRTDHWAIVGIIDEAMMNDKFSPAKKAELKRGDLIVSVNGKPVKDGMEVRRIVCELPIGKEFDVEFLRVDKEAALNRMTCKVMLEKKPMTLEGAPDHEGHKWRAEWR